MVDDAVAEEAFWQKSTKVRLGHVVDGKKARARIGGVVAQHGGRAGKQLDEITRRCVVVLDEAPVRMLVRADSSARERGGLRRSGARRVGWHQKIEEVLAAVSSTSNGTPVG